MVSDVTLTLVLAFTLCGPLITLLCWLAIALAEVTWELRDP